MFGNVEIKRIMSEGGVLWKKNTVPKPKLSWLATDTSTYVEANSKENGAQLYKIKDKYVDPDSVCLLVYPTSSLMFISFYKNVANIWINVERTSIHKKVRNGSLITNVVEMNGINQENARDYRIGFTNITDEKAIEERRRAKIYYYEFPKTTSINKLNEYINLIAENWQE